MGAVVGGPHERSATRSGGAARTDIDSLQYVAAICLDDRRGRADIRCRDLVDRASRARDGASREGVVSGGSRARREPPHDSSCFYSRSSSCFTSASVFRSFFSEKDRNELAIERAMMRSMSLFTTPSSVTWP